MKLVSRSRASLSVGDLREPGGRVTGNTESRETHVKEDYGNGASLSLCRESVRGT